MAYSKEELEKEYDIVKQEAKVSFNDDSLYLEKFVENPRHVEIQILADEHGNCIHLGERDCSVQRRNQKVLEETPSGILDQETRKKMGEAAVKAVKEIGYSNAGTIEFLVDKNKDFLFHGDEYKSASRTSCNRNGNRRRYHKRTTQHCKWRRINL